MNRYSFNIVHLCVRLVDRGKVKQVINTSNCSKLVLPSMLNGSKVSTNSFSTAATDLFPVDTSG